MFGSTFAAVDISATGLSAERFRMEIIANNIANAYSTRTSAGGPYRRQEVVFASALDSLAHSGSSGNLPGMHGVQVVGVTVDPTELPQVYQPSHPHADAHGMLTMPNVKMPNEMVDLITSSRAYEANLRAVRSFREMAQQTMSLLRGNG